MSEKAEHEIFDKIRAILPELRERAQETEDLRRIPDSNIRLLEDIGFFKLVQPAQWGGYECDPVTFYTAVKMLASACGSTGWVAGILGIHNWHLALFPQQAQEDVWGKDRSVRVSSSYAPMGAGVVTDDGYILNGKWSWSSGCDHADWVFLGGPVLKDGKPVDFCTFLVPADKYRIDDVWHVVGLRGTGSNDIIVEDAFIPRHHVLSFKDMAMSQSPGLETNTNPLYKMPWGTIHPTTITTPIVGMAEGAYGVHVEHQRDRVRAAFAGEKAKDDPFAKVRIAEAASEIDAAWLQVTRNLRDEFAALERGEQPSMDDRVRARRDQVRATQRAIDAIGLLFENSGARALVNSSPIQRFWRDAAAGRVHAANEANKAYVMFGSHAFGQSFDMSMV